LTIQSLTMKKNIFTIASLFGLAYTNIYAQNTPPIVIRPSTAISASNIPLSHPVNTLTNNSNPNTGVDMKRHYYIHDDYKVNGNRFFYDDNYRTGELWTKNGHYSSEMLFRLDQLEGTIQVKLHSGKEILIDEKSIIMFHLFIKDKKIVFVTHDIPNGRKNALLQVIYYSSNLQLLRDSKKVVVDVTSPNKVNEGAFYLEIQNDYHYYITGSDSEPLKEIHLTEKELTNIFPKHRNKIVKFFKVNSTKEKLTQTNLIQLLDTITQEGNNINNKD
jgi:hypothetical protein